MLSIKALLIGVAVTGAVGATGYVVLSKDEAPTQVAVAQMPASAPAVQAPVPAPEPKKEVAKPASNGPSVFVCQERVNNCKIRCKKSARGFAGYQEQVYACSQACIARGCNNR